jgi:hypothetical protein
VWGPGHDIDKYEYGLPLQILHSVNCSALLAPQSADAYYSIHCPTASVAFACSVKLLHRARAQSCLTCQCQYIGSCQYFSPCWTMDMQFRYSPPLPKAASCSPNPTFGPSVLPLCSSCWPSISRGHTTQGELPDTVAVRPGACREKCFSIRARSLPSKQKREEGTHVQDQKGMALLWQTAWAGLICATAHGIYWLLSISNRIESNIQHGEIR